MIALDGIGIAFLFGFVALIWKFPKSEGRGFKVFVIAIMTMFLAASLTSFYVSLLFTNAAEKNEKIFKAKDINVSEDKGKEDYR